MRQIRREIIRYIVVGGLNAAASFMVYLVLLDVLKTSYQLAFSFAWLFGVLLTYAFNFLWVFKTSDKLNFRGNFARYFIVYFSSYVINLTLLSWLVEAARLNPIYGQLLLLPFIVMFNFLMSKFWSLKRRAH